MYQNIFCTAHRGLVILPYFYSINSVICRPSDRTVVRPPPERAVYIKAGTLTTTPPYKTTTSEYRLSYCYKKKLKRSPSLCSHGQSIIIPLTSHDEKAVLWFQIHGIWIRIQDFGPIWIWIRIQVQLLIWI